MGRGRPGIHGRRAVQHAGTPAHKNAVARAGRHPRNDTEEMIAPVRANRPGTATD
jgi:hypothetical protein